MENNKVLALLGFASKARKLSFGTHATMYAITSKKAKLVCAAQDISAKSVKELRFNASKTNIPVIILKGITTELVSQRIGKSCGILAVNDEPSAKALIEAQSEIDEGGINL